MNTPAKWIDQRKHSPASFADYLCQAKDHPALVDFAQAMPNASLEARLANVRDEMLDLPQRAVAALSVLSTGSGGEISWTTSGLNTLLVTFRELGVPEGLAVAAEERTALRILPSKRKPPT